MKFAIAPSPKVAKVRKPNPTRTAFLAPSLFLMAELKGAKITWATENTLRIKETSKVEIAFKSLGTDHSCESINGGKNAAMFSIIMFPIVRAIRQATRAFFFTSGASYVSLASAFKFKVTDSIRPCGRPLAVRARW